MANLAKFAVVTFLALVVSLTDAAAISKGEPNELPRESTVTVSLTNDTLKEDTTSLSLQCVPKGVSSSDVKVTWMRDGKNLPTNGKYVIHAKNYTLVINDPVRRDMGEYICKIVFNAGVEDEYRVFVGAPPVIEGSTKKDIKLVQGEQLDLTCKVTGYPFPMLEWRKDGQKLNTSKRIHFSAYEGSPTGKLTIQSLELEDRGIYSCIASSTKFENQTATAEWMIRVKDKLAALWPFLGIVAELVVLCAIILISEKRKRNKMKDKDDPPGANEDEKKGRGDVRLRRT